MYLLEGQAGKAAGGNMWVMLLIYAAREDEKQPSNR